MEDNAIVELYFARSEQAIRETEQKYGAYLNTIAENILHLPEDAEETVSDTYLAAWNAIPPTRPRVLRHFLSRIVRNKAFQRYGYLTAANRSAETEVLLSEIEDCLPDGRQDTTRRMEQRAITQSINRFLGSLSREALIGTLWNLSDEEAAYVIPETAAAESEAGWSCAVTESLYTGEKIMLSVAVRAGDGYLLVPTYVSPQDSVREIGLAGSETLQAYADRLGKALLYANARMDFADWDTNGQGLLVKSWSTDEITLVIFSEQRTRGPEALSGSCRVLVRNQKTGDKDFEVLPLNLTAAPEPEGDVKIFHPLSADSVPGMKFQDGTLTKTLRGYRLQLTFTVTDENTWKTYWKVYCEDLNLYGLLDFETGNLILDDSPTNDFSSVVIQILDDDSNIAGTLEVREYIG